MEPNYRRLTVGNPRLVIVSPCYSICKFSRQERTQKVVHKRQKKNQRDNENIAVNLATMDTCGDCDDEDA